MPSKDHTFRADVEGLRAVAVGLVVLSHAAVPGLEGGYIGVDVFFVLSGFLITGLLIRERMATGRTSMLGFYARRARRILPAASLVLVVTVFASYEWLGFLRGDVIAEDGKWAAVFAANLRFASEGTQYLNIAAPPSPLQHYWSLAVEEQFYVVWPLLFMLVAAAPPHRNLRAKLVAVLAVIIVASLGWSVVQTGSNSSWAFFSPLTRAWELAAGALLAVSAPQLSRLPAHVGPWLGWGGLSVVVTTAFVFDGATAFPGYAALLPVVATAMVVVSGTIAPGRGTVRVLGLPPFQMLGKWSYALYLWHWPLLLIPAQRAGHELSLVQNLGLVAVALALSAATHYLLENPIRYARPLVRSPWPTVSLAVTLVVATYVTCGWQLRDNVSVGSPFIAAHALDTPPPPEATATPDDPIARALALVAAAPSIVELPEDLTPDLRRAAWDFAWLAPWAQACLLDPEDNISPPCEFGDVSGSRTIVLLGDSHAAQWIQSLDAAGERRGWKVVLLAKAGCPAASLTFRNAYGSGPNKLVGPAPDCPAWLTDAISRINEMQPDAVILASCNGCVYMVDADGEVLSREVWAAGLRESLHRITSPRTSKFILADNPRWHGPLDCLATHADDVQACSRPADVVTEVTYNDVERTVAAETSARYIDVTPWFCSEVCSPVVGQMVVYTNEYHVTATYARALSSVLEAVLHPAIEAP